MHKLPTALEHEPLVDALFEVRLKDSPSLAVILPGILFHELGLDSPAEKLPIADIPSPVRAKDPGLQYAPVVRLKWEKYYISVGERSIVVSCDMREPYPKWPNFKNAILRIIDCIGKIKVPGKVERYSLKYVNLITTSSLADQVSKINMSISLGNVNIKDEQVNIQVHKKEKDIVHILSVITGASGRRATGEAVSGVIVDIDSIRLMQPLDFSEFSSSLEPCLEELRQENKVKFFGCLRDATIQEMGPAYE